MTSLGKNAALCSLILLSIWCGSAWGHMFSVRSEPGAGTTLDTSPLHVRIWFDGALDPVSSVIVVQDMKGKRVDKGDGHVGPSDPTLLETSLPPLPRGTYRVIWRAVARDGHAASGDYTFVIK
jgi:methionine-rich copper-binding protein CopC